MATIEEHHRFCEKRLREYLAFRMCDTCEGGSDLALVYRKRWWHEVALTTWAQTNYNLLQTLSKSRITCRPCITARMERIRMVLTSGKRFPVCQDEEGCSNPIVGRGYCAKHRYAYLPLTKIPPRSIAPRGSGQITEDGYRVIYLPGHPNANRYGRILEHRKILADKLGRPLLPNESAHHKNGIRDDNRPENLELWVKSQPPGQRASDLVAWAREIVYKYGDEVDRGLAS